MDKQGHQVDSPSTWAELEVLRSGCHWLGPPHIRDLADIDGKRAGVDAPRKNRRELEASDGRKASQRILVVGVW